LKADTITQLAVFIEMQGVDLANGKEQLPRIQLVGRYKPHNPM
jgi:hypothetical protein